MLDQQIKNIKIKRKNLLKPPTGSIYVSKLSRANFKETKQISSKLFYRI